MAIWGVEKYGVYLVGIMMYIVEIRDVFCGLVIEVVESVVVYCMFFVEDLFENIWIFVDIIVNVEECCFGVVFFELF